MHLGPKIVRDGLVLGYDTGANPSSNFDHKSDQRRFFKGRNATNLFTVLGSPSYSDQNVTFSVNGTGTFKRVAIGTVIGDYTVTADDVVYSYDLGSNGCHYHGNDYATVSNGTQVSLSIEYFLTNDVDIVTNYLGNFEQLAGVSGTWGTVSSETGKWHKVTLTRTATGTGNLRMLMYPGGCSSSRLSAQGKIYYKNPTVTLTDQPVPFVSGTRSSTQSLLDLTKSSTIDVSNVSFGSDGLPTFDGTDDYITLPTGLLDGTGDFTVDAVIQANASEIGGSIFGNYPSGNLQVFFGSLYAGMWLNNTSTYLGTFPFTTTLPEFTTNPIHITAGRSGTTTYFYINGELEKTGSSSSTIGSTSAVFRAGTNTSTTEQFTGDIFLLKVYNRALTAQEIQQNYKAYKNRFNL